MLFTAGLVTPVAADVFTVKQDDDTTATIEARIYGEGEGVFLLLRDDGAIEIVPQNRIVKRKPSDGPEPATPEEVAERLKKRFTPELCRTHVAGNHVIALRLTAPITEAAEKRLGSFFKKVEQFVLSLDRSFGTWAKKAKLPADDPEFPLVMVIFETDADFEDYAREVTNRDGSVGTLSGFYAHASNWLAVRADECDSYTLPLHEGIHQQVYNRGWYKRFAPVPVWFDEGIATGFENDGDRLRGDPSKVNRLYATLSASGMQLEFTDVIASDFAFRGGELTGDAYTRAWALHWLLFNTREQEYVDFVKELGTRKPLESIPPIDRLKNFFETFDINPVLLQATYERKLEQAARAQRVRPVGRPKPGVTTQQDQSGLVNVKVLMTNEGVVTQGKLKNISPFRDWTFRVRVLTDGTPPLTWVMPNVRSYRQVTLDKKTIPLAAKKFSVEVRSALPDSDEAKQWTEARGL